jgi:predicted secreted hydrolase
MEQPALTANQTGWDWFSLHLDSGEQVMLYRMRQKDGAPYLTGTWIDAQGQTQLLKAGDIRLTVKDSARVAGRSMPVSWSIRFPASTWTSSSAPSTQTPG